VNVVVTEQLTKRYGQRIGVEGLDLQVPEGALYGFLGPNGSGKTTTIRVLLGLLRPSNGSAVVFGLNCWKDSHRIKADLGYVPGDLRLYPGLTTHDALRWSEQVRGRDLTLAGNELVDDFGLDPEVKVRNMSRGMKQKLGLILALVHRPRLLVLDEPTTGLDPLMQDRLCRRLRRLAAEGHTIFFSSHTLGEVENLCDRVAIMRQGRLVADESLDSLRARASRRVVIRWGEDQVNGAEAPPFLDVQERRMNEWHGRLTGSAMDLVRWSAGKSIEDISIGQPNLEEMFQQFYRSDSE